MHETPIGLIAGEPLSPVSPGTQSLALQSSLVGPAKEIGTSYAAVGLLLQAPACGFRRSIQLTSLREA